MLNNQLFRTPNRYKWCGGGLQNKFMFIVIPLNIETILLIIFYSSFASVPQALKFRLNRYSQSVNYAHISFQYTCVGRICNACQSSRKLKVFNLVCQIFIPNRSNTFFIMVFSCCMMHMHIQYITHSVQSINLSAP